VSEEDGLKGWFTKIEKSVIRFFTDAEMHPEILKFLLVFLVLTLYLVIFKNVPVRVRMIRLLFTGILFVIFIFVNQLFVFAPSPWLYFVSPVTVVILLAILHLYTERILLVRWAESEKHVLREQISRDLHDDLASTLGSISIYSNSLKNMNDPGDVNYRKLTSKIAELTHSAMESITDIIWMTAPRYDSLQKLLSKTTDLMQEVLTDNQIAFLAESDIPDNEIRLNEKLRNDVFLILKEGLHNIIAHSGAVNVTLSASVKEMRCRIVLTDDGYGFSENEIKQGSSHGNGLLNMKKRAADSGILLKVESEINTGTSIQLDFKI
jgi:signal transduction histidine kinase